ncbi:MAG: hypothetical protein M1277_01030 [Patescibacteria group bacterium]|nr:hypothetical protein [Patescibacteria group bacterium]
MDKNNLPSINLIRKEGVSFFDSFLNWVLTYGRFLVIVTELIALSAFLYRFSLDRKLSDLRDQIKQKQAVVDLLKNNENTYRNLQDRLSEIALLGDSAVTKAKIIKNIISLVPYGFFIDTITESSSSIMVSGHATSSQALLVFIDRLKNYQYTDSVNLTNIENKTAQASLAVTISVLLKKNPALVNYETK